MLKSYKVIKHIKAKTVNKTIINLELYIRI